MREGDGMRYPVQDDLHEPLPDICLDGDARDIFTTHADRFVFFYVSTIEFEPRKKIGCPFFLFSISLCHIRDRIQFIRIMKKRKKKRGERARGRIEITSSTLFSFRCPWRRERIGSRFLSRLDNPTSVPLRVTTCMLQGWASPKCMSVLAKIKI